VPDKHTEQMLALKEKYLIPCVFHFYQEPMVLERGEGCYLTDTEGRRYLDCYSGVGVNNCGHAHPQITKDTLAQVKRLQHTTTIYLTEPMLRLAEALANFIPGSCNKSFFCSSGSEANEGALLLSKLATDRNDFIALDRGLHGRTYLTAGVTGIEFWRTDPKPPHNIHFAPSPDCGNCPYKLSHPDCELRCADEVEHILDKNPGKVAAMIAESVHGNGGIIVPPEGYFKRIQQILEKHGVLLIMDEAQTGFCRTGKRFGFEHHGIQPDIITVCKALGNGMPISAFIATNEVADKYTRPGASTFGGNLVCAATALSVLRLMEQQQLEQAAQCNGEKLKRILETLQEQFSLIKEVRGLGMMLGAELVRENGEPAAEEMDVVLEALKDKGFLVGKTGPNRNVMTLMPPLILEQGDIDALAAGLSASFTENFR
jgi:4-aminobutyrate aminotransferase-like enzyme